MREKAYAKINLSLDVVKRRLDGYHNIDSIFLPLQLHDEIDIEIAEKDDYFCDDGYAIDHHSIIYKCVEMLRKEFDLSNHYKIRVKKNIPALAGLAGGSSDGAATLRIINQLENLGLSYSQLACFGKKIGADIPFCIYQQAARVTGIGEIIEHFRLEKSYDVLLIKPTQGIDTATSFQMLDLSKCIHPDIGKLKQAFVKGQSIFELLGNSLQYSASRLCPQVDEIINEVKNKGYHNVLMTGSGSTVFVLAYENEDLDLLEKEMKKKYDFVYKTKILTM